MLRAGAHEPASGFIYERSRPLPERHPLAPVNGDDVVGIYAAKMERAVMSRGHVHDAHRQRRVEFYGGVAQVGQYASILARRI